MSDEEERKRLTNHATEVIERFSLEKVVEIWGAVIKGVLRERQK